MMMLANQDIFQFKEWQKTNVMLYLRALQLKANLSHAETKYIKDKGNE